MNPQFSGEADANAARAFYNLLAEALKRGEQADAKDDLERACVAYYQATPKQAREMILRKVVEE